MDDEKSITAKLTDALSKAAGSVKSAASSLVDKASNAAQHAMEVNAEKISRIPPAKTGPAQAAATTGEQVIVPAVSDAAAMPMPLFPAAPARKKKRAPAPTSKMRAIEPKKNKPAKKSATKSANKAAKKAAVTKTKKTAKKSSVRSSKKAKRKSRK